jgi:hypothetical protein
LIYFVTAGRADEVAVIQNLQPPRLLVSYAAFKNKPIKEFKELLGYNPDILLDSGAYTAWTTGKNIALMDYIDYVKKNESEIEHHIALDVIDDMLGDEFSKRYYDMMLIAGLEPVPVYHRGDDLSYLEYYVDCEPPFIALGGTAKDSNKKAVRDWVLELNRLYPEQEFHLLGSSSKQITDYTSLRSYDSSTWIMMALNGFPKEIPGKNIEAKRERMTYHMREGIK